MTKEELISKINEENKVFEEKVKGICREYAQEHAVFKKGVSFTTVFLEECVVIDTYWCNLRKDIVCSTEDKKTGEERLMREEILRANLRMGALTLVRNDE